MTNSCRETVSDTDIVGSSLPVLQNVGYDEEVEKYEEKIMKHFQEEEKEVEKIHGMEVRIEELAFETFKEEMENGKESKRVQKLSD